MDISKIRNTIICGDCIEIMRQMPDECIDCCVTRPPYWGLRDYGVEGQLGMEKTPEEYIEKMVAIFREVRRILKPHGTCWVNLGDTYISGKGRSARNGLKDKDLAGIPWRFALAAQADGWYLRQDIIWHKPNPLPDGVRDRCTKAHEYIFFLTKSKRYYYDYWAVIEKAAQNGMKPEKNKPKIKYINSKFTLNGRIDSIHTLEKNQYPSRDEEGQPLRNRRSVWTVPFKGFSGAHFATFPPDLIRPCILAGCPECVCKRCRKYREHVIRRDNGYNVYAGWTDCGCGAGFEPGIVLDPFMGAGTTALVARKSGRDYIGIELNQEYKEMAENRIKKETEKMALFA